MKSTPSFFPFVLWLVLNLMGGLFSPAYGQTTSPAPTTQKAAKPADPIVEDLISGDASRQNRAISQIRQLLANPATASGTAIKLQNTAGGHDMTWSKAFLKAERYSDLFELCGLAIPVVAASTGHVEHLQVLRVEALMRSGKLDDALKEAKRLYDVASIRGTGIAISYVLTTLRGATSVDGRWAEEFRQEQAVSQDGTISGISASVLSRIAIDSGPFPQYAKAIEGSNYWNCQARGNLLLLAGMIDEAEKEFLQAYVSADKGTLAEASENLARCMRARDGHLGHANAWLMTVQAGSKTGTVIR